MRRIDSPGELGKGKRVEITGGPYRGRRGKLVRKDGVEWMVKLDGKMFGTNVARRDMKLVRDE